MKRYRFKVCKRLVRTYRKMMKSLGAEKIIVVKEEMMYFSTDDIFKVERHFNKLGIKLTEVKQ